MDRRLGRRFFRCDSGNNLKSKIQKRPRGPKWVGIFAIALTFTFGGAVVKAQQPNKIFRIGYISTRDPAREFTRAEGIRRALHEQGYIEGQNLAIEYRYARGKRDQLPELAAQLVRLKVDIILPAGGIAVIEAVKNATKTIPVVMTGVGIDPVEGGLVDSLARPGANVTGITNIGGQLDGKRLELLRDAVPKLARVAVLYAPANPSSVLAIKEDLPAAARALGLTIQPWEMRAVDDFVKAFAAMGKQRPDGYYVLAGALMRANLKRIVQFGLKAGLPSMFTYKEFVDAGGFMSYGADEADSYRRVAYYVDRILKGAKPADLPIQQPTKFDLVINLKTAKKIGLTIPPEVLMRVDKIIK